MSPRQSEARVLEPVEECEPQVQRPVRISIFDPVTESLNLGMGVVSALLVAVAFFHGYPQSRGFAHDVSMLINFPLFSVTHVPLTFILLFCLPEVKDWGRTRPSWTRFSWHHLIALGLLLIFLFGILAHSSLGTRWHWIAYATAGFFVLRDIHAIGQFRGLASLYNHRAREVSKPSGKILEKFLFHEKVEKRLFQVLAALTAFVIGFFPFHVLPTKVVEASIVAGFAVVAGLIVNSLLFPGARASNKPLFTIRYVFVPLFFGGFMPAFWALSLMHGVEYLFVYRKMKGNSIWGAKPSVSSALFWLAFVTGIVLYYPVLYRPWVPGISPIVLAPVVALQFVLEFGHYYVDALMFRFSRPEVREHVGPLLRSA